MIKLIIIFFIGLIAYSHSYKIVAAELTEVCVSCHGADGNSTTLLWPKIAGLSEEYLLKQLTDFKQGENGKRFDPTMFGILNNMNAQDLAELASFYASQKMTTGEVAADKFELGQKIYRGGNPNTGVPACTACHGPKGAGLGLANFPRLGGQNPDYVAAQLRKFKNKERTNDVNEIMRDIAAKMSEQEIEAVSSYVYGLQ